MNQLSADALVFVRRIDIKAGQFALLLRGINVQRHARHRVPVDFEDVVIRQVLLHLGARPPDQLSRFHCLLGQQLDGPDIFLLGRPDLFVFVGVNQRADALVGEHFGQQPFVLAAVDNVDALHARGAGGSRVAGLGKHFRRKSAARGLDKFLQVPHQHLANESDRCTATHPAR